MAATMEGNVGLAFGLVFAAGACTCLGALLVFFSNLANARWLSGSLGASAGVMIYVSFVEILSAKAVQGFKEAGFSEGAAQRYAAFAFFGGLLSTWLLGRLVDLLAGLGQAWADRKAQQAELAMSALVPAAPITTTTATTNPHHASSRTAAPPASPQQQQQQQQQQQADPELGLDAPPTARTAAAHTAAHTAAGAAALGGAACASKDASQGGPRSPAAARGDRDCGPARDSSSARRRWPGGPAAAAAAAAAAPESGGARGRGGARDGREEEDGGAAAPRPCCCGGGGGCRRPAGASGGAVEADPALVAVLASDKHAAELTRMGLLTGLAVGLHNLPEGIATFAAALASPAMGVVIAVAIALHNVPEGVAVALPIYYATGSKWRGFVWAAASGAAEPLGGLIGYAVLSSTGMSQLAFGLLFGYVAGMMVYISVRELLPTALRYDPADACATACAFWGMAVMAASLLLFRAREQ